MGSELTQIQLNELTQLNSPLALIFVFIGLSVIPFLLLGTSAYIKISVVFGILRNALGLQQVPSVAVTTLMSLALTLHVMNPVFSEIKNTVDQHPAFAEKLTIIELFSIANEASQPLADFLRKNSRIKERLFFLNPTSVLPELDSISELCATEVNPETSCEFKDETFASLVPAFIISQLREAFALGFSIFLPFLIIDLVISNLLLALGMMMVSPMVISLPFKLLLFVICDGWFLISQTLVQGFS